MSSFFWTALRISNDVILGRICRHLHTPSSSSVLLQDASASHERGLGVAQENEALGSGIVGRHRKSLYDRRPASSGDAVFRNRDASVEREKLTLVRHFSVIYRCLSGLPFSRQGLFLFQASVQDPRSF